MDIFKNETLEDLQLKNLKLIQKKDSFRFGLDAVLLSDFSKDIPSRKTLDLCTGSGIIPILMSAKTKTAEIHGIEIQKDIYDTACRSVALNNLTDRIYLKCADLKNCAEIYPPHSFDLITCNPPYMPAGSAVKNETDTKIIARHEVMCTLEDVISVSAHLLRFRGFLAMVHKPSRLADILCLMRKYGIEPKKIRFIHKSPESEPSLILVCGSYKGGRELRVMPPLFLHNPDGSETEELKRIYGR